MEAVALNFYMFFMQASFLLIDSSWFDSFSYGEEFFEMQALLSSFQFLVYLIARLDLQSFEVIRRGQGFTWIAHCLTTRISLPPLQVASDQPLCPFLRITRSRSFIQLSNFHLAEILSVTLAYVGSLD